MLSLKYLFFILGSMVIASFATPPDAESAPPSTTDPARLEERQNCGQLQTHTVTAGENLNGIAATAGVGVCNIATRNALTDINSIDIGHVFSFASSGCEPKASGTQCCIPAGSPLVFTASTGYRHWDQHVTRGVRLASIISANPNAVPTAIPVGFTITIPARGRVNC